jgi:SIR2-like domain
MQDDQLRQHCVRVVDAMLHGGVVPFLGAGVNLCDRPSEVEWQPSQTQYLPSGRELAEYLALKFRYSLGQICSATGCPRPKPELDLARISQFGDTTLGTGPLYEELRSVFSPEYPITNVHRFLASLLSRVLMTRHTEDRYPLVVTTNYDDLMERSLEEIHQQFDLVFYGLDDNLKGRFLHRKPDGRTDAIEKSNEYPYPFFEQCPVVLKIHGTIDRVNEDRGDFVITEDHYIEYLAEEALERLLPPALLGKLRTNHLLFLGYSLRDWNTRVFLRRLKRHPKRAYKSWAVLLHADESEQQFWLKNNVEIVIRDLDEYVKLLHEELQSRADTPSS